METARVALGIAAAVLIPWGVGWIGRPSGPNGPKQRPRLALVFSVAYAGYALIGAPVRLWPVAALVGACLALASALLAKPWPPSNANIRTRLSNTFTNSNRAVVALLAAALLIGICAAGPWSSLRGEHLVLDDRVAVILSSLLLTVFCGGHVALWVTHHVEVEVHAKMTDPDKKDDVLDFMSRGRVIGWLERGVLFAFLIAGHSEAAALALAAKSLARTPELDKGGKYVAEYFLLGTLTSVSTALAMGVVARLAMGMPPL